MLAIKKDPSSYLLSCIYGLFSYNLTHFSQEGLGKKAQVKIIQQKQGDRELQ